MSDRPGGWVDGIGWVAALGSLHPEDWCRTFQRGPGDMGLEYLTRVRLSQPVIVTRWADGTAPVQPPVQPNRRNGPDSEDSTESHAENTQVSGLHGNDGQVESFF